MFKLGIKERGFKQVAVIFGGSLIDFKLQFGVKNRMLILAMSGRQLSGILGLTNQASYETDKPHF